MAVSSSRECRDPEATLCQGVKWRAAQGACSECIREGPAGGSGLGRQSQPDCETPFLDTVTDSSLPSGSQAELLTVWGTPLGTLLLSRHVDGFTRGAGEFRRLEAGEAWNLARRSLSETGTLGIIQTPCAEGIQTEEEAAVATA